MEYYSSLFISQTCFFDTTLLSTRYIDGVLYNNDYFNTKIGPIHEITSKKIHYYIFCNLSTEDSGINDLFTDLIRLVIPTIYVNGQVYILKFINNNISNIYSDDFTKILDSIDTLFNLSEHHQLLRLIYYKNTFEDMENNYTENENEEINENIPDIERIKHESCSNKLIKIIKNYLKI
jgi:hypothetical protein